MTRIHTDTIVGTYNPCYPWLIFQGPIDSPGFVVFIFKLCALCVSIFLVSTQHSSTV